MAISQETLAILRKVRTSDVTDALDSLGMTNSYEMDPRIRPMWPGIFFAGIASTASFNIIHTPMPRMSYEEFDDRQYKRNPDGSTHPDALWPGGHSFGAPDEVHVVDTKQSRCGLLGSNNLLAARLKGSVGFIIDGACRDSDECILQKEPIFCTIRSMRHMAGRLELASVNEPITCGGVVVRPGDGIVADSDGVIVVPQAEADEVAKRAWLVQDKDRRMRRAFYKEMGLAYDKTVELEERPW